MEHDFFALAQKITTDYKERLAQQDIIRAQDEVIVKQAAVIETLEQMVKNRDEQIALLKEALQP